MEFVPLHIIHLNQDDPKNVLQRKWKNMKMLSCITEFPNVTKKRFLVKSRSNNPLGPDDKRMIDLGASLVALDCSWKQIDASY